METWTSSKYFDILSPAKPVRSSIDRIQDAALHRTLVDTLSGLGMWRVAWVQRRIA